MSDGRGKWLKIRLHLVGLAFLLVFAAVMYKAYTLQVVQRESLMSKARAEVERHLSLGAVRGEIFDATGERLAASLAVASLYADASMMKTRQEKNEAGEIVTIDEKEEVAGKLHELLGLDQDELKKKLETNRKFIWLKRQLEMDQASAVEALRLPGLRLSKEYRRSYPNGSLAAHFLGFVGVDGQGLEGLESSLDDRLQAGQDKVKVKRDNLGRIMVDNVDVDLEQTRGGSVVLTIDRRIQYIAEKALARAVITHKAKSGMALVMRPKTGAIVASAVWPTFDPNDYQRVPSDFRRNRILTDPFEPGSTMKVFVVAAALEEGVVNPNTVIHCENGAFRVANHTVKDTHNYGDLTVSEIIKYSSNIGSLKVGGILGNDLLYNYLTRFSFGERTGLAYLRGEAAGLVRPSKQWRQLEAANIAFGQGVSVTALQMVMGMSSLANQGVLMKPYIVDRVLDENGRIVEQYEPQILRQVVSPFTAAQVSAMLRMAVMKGGTATRADVEGYPVAGKTGTAQKVSRGAKSYSAGKYVASFLGFAPYHDPQLCVMVVLDEPQNGYYGGTVAAPAFKEIMENALPLLDIPPTEGRGEPVWPSLQRNNGGAPGMVEGDQPTNFIRVRLNMKKNDRGRKGPITFASLPAEKAVVSGIPEPVFAETPLALATDPGVMPNLAGLSMRQVQELMSGYGLDLEYQGSGYVVGQTPLAGTAVVTGQAASVVFSR